MRGAYWWCVGVRGVMRGEECVGVRGVIRGEYFGCGDVRGDW